MSNTRFTGRHPLTYASLPLLLSLLGTSVTDSRAEILTSGDIIGFPNETDDLVIGSTAPGTLTVNDDFGDFTSIIEQVVDTPLGAVIGQFDGGQGTVTITDPGSEWNLGGGLSELDFVELTVGDAGSGTLDILNGGEVSVRGLDLAIKEVRVARQAGSSGTINIGSGGLLEIIGNSEIADDYGARLSIGGAGTGTVTVGDGGRLVVAKDSDSDGNARLRVGGINADEAGGEGTLTIATGGNVEVSGVEAAVQVGRYADSVGTINVQGALDVIGGAGGASVQIGREGGRGGVLVDGGILDITALDSTGGSAVLLVGRDSTGTLDIINGGEVILRGDALDGESVVALGRDAGSSGTMTIIGDGSLLELLGNGRQLVVGNEGEGNLTVEEGGLVEAAQLQMGVGSDAYGELNVVGLNSEVYIEGMVEHPVIVGDMGEGQINLADGALLSTEFAGLTLGHQAGGVGVINVSASLLGVGNEDTLSGEPILVGAAGTGTLNVSSGGQVLANAIGAGDEAGSSGTINLSGTDTSLITLGDDNTVRIGLEGQGELNISSGATLSTLSLEIGRFDGGTGTANISGAETLVIISSENGQFTDEDSLNDGGFLRVARNEGSQGTLIVNQGATLIVQPGLETGNSDSGIQIAREAGSTGTMTVQGEGTLVTVGGPQSFIQVGRAGDATLDVTDQALVQLSGDDATLMVSRGNADEVEIAPVLSESRLTVSNATVAVEGTNARLAIGTQANGNGVVQVTDGGLLTVTGLEETMGNIFVGSSGRGSLSVLSGGQVSGDQLLVASEAGSRGTVTVSGEGSRLEADRIVLGALDLDGPDLPAATLGVNGGGVVATELLSVAQGATLLGNGRISGSVEVTAGSVAPSGNLTVGGNFTLNAGSLAIDVTDADNFDVLSVNAQATVGPEATLAFSSPEDLTLAVGDTLTFLNAEGLDYREPIISFGNLSSPGVLAVVPQGTDGLLNGLALTVLESTLLGEGDISPEELLVGRQGGLDLGEEAAIIGITGTGSLQINDDTLEIDDLTLGQGGDAIGTVRVAGAETRLLGNGDTTVGNLGTGNLTVADRGTVTLAGNLTVAAQAGADGVVEVLGADSSLNLTGESSRLELGAGTAGLNLFDGGRVTAPRVVAGYQGGNSTVIIRDGAVLTTDQLALGPTGFLEGNGTLVGNLLVQGGSVSPASSPGTLTVNGDLNFQAGILNIEIAGTGEDEHDLLAVSGTAVVGEDSTVAFTLLDEFVPADGDEFTFLVAAEGLETFSPALELPALAGVAFEVVTDDTSATLVASREDITPEPPPPGLPTNQREVGETISNLCTTAPIGSALARDCALLSSATDAELTEALDQLTPAEAAAPLEAAQSNLGNQLRTVGGRIAALRAGAGTDVAGAGLAPMGHALGMANAKTLLQAQGGGAGDDAAADFGRWGMYLTGSAGTGDKDATDREAGYDFDTRGVTLGADYRVNDQLVVGGALGYNTTEVEFDNNRGDLDNDGYNLTLYGTWYQDEAFYVDATLSLGRNDYDQKRRIAYQVGDTRVRQNATADFDGRQTSFGIGGGYEFNRGALTFGPVGRLAYTKTKVDGFEESPSNPTGAGASLVTSMPDQDVKSLTLSVGGQVSYASSQSWGVVVPNLRLEWVHEFEDDARTIDGRFVSDDATFPVETDDPDRNYVNALVGVSAVLPGGKTAYAYAESVLGKDDLSSTSVSLGVRWEFW